jgi:type IV pilus assembly protein PilE
MSAAAQAAGAESRSMDAGPGTGRSELMNSLRRQRGVTRHRAGGRHDHHRDPVAVAISSYRAYVIRSQRSDAKDALLALANQQENHYLQCNTFATAIDAATSCADGKLQGTSLSRNGWYSLAISAANATTFTVTATAVIGADQYQDIPCRVFIVDQAGVRTAADSGGVRQHRRVLALSGAPRR